MADGLDTGRRCYLDPEGQRGRGVWAENQLLPSEAKGLSARSPARPALTPTLSPRGSPPGPHPPQGLGALDAPPARLPAASARPRSPTVKRWREHTGLPVARPSAPLSAFLPWFVASFPSEVRFILLFLSPLLFSLPPKARGCLGSHGWPDEGVPRLSPDGCIQGGGRTGTWAPRPQLRLPRGHGSPAATLSGLRGSECQAVPVNRGQGTCKSQDTCPSAACVIGQASRQQDTARREDFRCQKLHVGSLLQGLCTRAEGHPDKCARA
ncbi:uncharacterized protein LOC121024282 [Herpailurus yagouaroundi]|uniref:uncharacterized protein LOC121024282 n=1 Tax=Herpailurus yagouaroundi TaxID=1608482 RepID=UPI001AD67F0B|nr:uncharacterized protein LOC121024282 [Puma yagouaroundi]